MENSTEGISSRLEAVGACIVIPTYNNQKTLARVLDEMLAIANKVIVVNDGSTDNTAQILANYIDRITVVTHAVNHGKGMALRNGFTEAIRQGFKYAITIDSDGQHYPDDLPKFLNAIELAPGTMVMGARNLSAEGMPGKNSFANRFSNFWFWVQTGIELPDTQTGYRAYPLDAVGGLRFFTNRFEFEIEVIVKLAWAGVPFSTVPIKVLYDPNERVTHFRPGPDFTRISLLNTYLTLLTLLWYLPKRLLHDGKIFRLIWDEARKHESPQRKAASIGLGFFFGILPIWGFQLAIGIPTAVFLRLNKVLFIASANISIPPFIPFIIWGSYLAGRMFVGDNSVQLTNISHLTLENIHDNFIQYFLGGTLLALLAGVVGYLGSLFVFSIFERKK